jgi:hypothetical protein
MVADMGAEQGRESRLEEVYVRSAPAGFRLAYLLTGDRALAEDLVQEASCGSSAACTTCETPNRTPTVVSEVSLRRNTSHAIPVRRKTHQYRAPSRTIIRSSVNIALPRSLKRPVDRMLDSGTAQSRTCDALDAILLG